MFGEKDKDIAGFGFFRVKVSKPGDIELKASSGYVFDKKIISIKPLSLLFIKLPEFFNTSSALTTSSDYISVTIGVGDYFKQYFETQSEIYNINLSLECYQAHCSGTKLSNRLNGTTYKAFISFQSFRIFSGGLFRLRAECMSYNVVAYSQPFLVYNDIMRINVRTSSKKIIQGYPLTLIIRIIAEDYGLYSLPSLITISSISQEIHGNYSIYNSIGIVTTNVYFLKSEEMSINITCEKVSNVINNITIIPVVIKATNLGNFNINKGEHLHFAVEVKTKKGKYVKNYPKDAVQIVLIGDAEADKGIGYIINNKTNKTTVEINNGKAEITKFTFKSGGKVYIYFAIGNTKSNILGPYDIHFPICGFGKGPISSYSTLLFLYLSFSIFFYFKDKNVRSYKTVKFLFLFMYPLTAFWYKQPGLRRLLLCAQAFVSELLILTLIGAIYYKFDKPDTKYESDFEHFDRSQFYKGACGYALAQVPIIALFFLNFYYVNNRKYVILSILLSVILIVMCFGGVIYMTLDICIGYSTYWTANFMIFWMLDLLTFQIIYSVICMHCTPETLKKILKNKVPERSEENNEISVVYFNAENNQFSNEEKKSENLNDLIEDNKPITFRNCDDTVNPDSIIINADHLVEDNSNLS
ncbi:hypothetical protein SteCoe_28096 [Stentor coeruleus]|uniref:Uncharacterized protein n=1 Tax=Stentor coeruleus TaxID=5963 RepID=A0A1R2B983_9CILI|nr:hypothetical protein SteCoe_28096 [Stentor coeruleus]